MELSKCKVKSEYRSLIDNVVQDFYIPLLKNAVYYRRAVGFFSSTSLVEISKGIAEMAKHGGKIQIVASPFLSEEDIEAIKKGYSRREEIIESALMKELSDEHTDYYSMERLNLLANLIADGVLDIRIAYTEDKNGKKKYYDAEDDEQLNMPLCVLVNGNSASASEILAGAIKDRDAGTLVGEKTFGKGIVQGFYGLGDDSYVKLTYASYYTPDGHNIHKKGIQPDVKVEDDEDTKADEQLQRAVAVLQDEN